MGDRLNNLLTAFGFILIASQAKGVLALVFALVAGWLLGRITNG